MPQRRMFLFLVLTTVASTVGMQSWLNLINSFAVERVAFSALDMGMTHSVREIPGLLSFAVLLVLLRVQEHRAAALFAALCGLGLAATGFFPSFAGIVGATLVMSLGFHYCEPLNQSLSLQYFSLAESPLILGRLRAATALAAIGASGAAWGLSHWLDYPGLFAVLGLAAAALGLAALGLDPVDRTLPPQRRRMVLRSRYWLFYALTFLTGARRQILMVFAMFLLVKKFGFSVQAMTLLFLLNNAVNFVANPLIGRVIAAVGERTLLLLEPACAIAVFMVYAFTGSATAAAAAFVFDQLTANFVIAQRTYFQKIADPQDIAPSMAAAFTINHVAAVFLPVAGGALWLVSDRIPFLIGAGFSAVSLGLAFLLPRGGGRTA